MYIVKCWHRCRQYQHFTLSYLWLVNTKTRRSSCHNGVATYARRVNMTNANTSRILPLFAARCYASAAYAVMKDDVCPSACHVRGFCRNEWTYLQILSPSGSHTILVFFSRIRSHGSIPTRRSTLTGTSNEGEVGKSRDSGRISGYRFDDCWVCDQQFAVVGAVVSNSYGARLLTAPRVTHRSVNTPKRREHNRI